MDTAELRYRIVAVFEEDLFIQLFRSSHPDRGVDRIIPGDIELADELIEEEPP